MDRRKFLQSAGMTAAGTALLGGADAFAATSESGSSPAFISTPPRDRLNIQSNDLSPWTPSTGQPWDTHTINHLYRRAGFGATLAEIKAASLKTPSEVVDALLNDSLKSKATVPPLPTHADDTNQPPSWLHVPPYVYSDFNVQMTDYSNGTNKIRSHWVAQMNQPEVMLRERLTLFWMNHFVIEAKKVMWPQMTYNFLTYIRKNPWGNFKQMVSDITILPGMLYYLDGVSNVGKSPNENYARELQELFTMGVYYKNNVNSPNYTQDDIEAVAHVLTGWTVDYQAPAPNVLPAKYDVNLHDSSLQKIYDGVKRSYTLSASGVDAKDLIDHIFEQRGDQIAWYICSKLYQNFVYHDISGSSELAVIDAMAALFKQSNWELKPVISALLKSEHFFDDANIGAQIKSPIDHLIGLARTFDIQIDELSGGSIFYYALGGSQVLLDPPNVKGWPGYHNWISTTTLPYRNLISGSLLISKTLDFFSKGGYTDGYKNALKSIDLPADNILLANWAKQFTNYSGTFDDILAEVATYLCAHTPTDNALLYIRGLFPPQAYEWSFLDDATKLRALLTMAAAITQLADYQLS
jgi:hypothetical protein